MPDDGTIPKVFICNARKDNDSSDPREFWPDRVQRHLEPFVTQGDFEVFCDEVIQVGDDWHARIQGQLCKARVVLLLISAAFLASRSVKTNELPVRLQRAHSNGIKILPIIVSPCGFDSVPFKYPDPKSGPERRKRSLLQGAETPSGSL